MSKKSTSKTGLSALTANRKVAAKRKARGRKVHGAAQGATKVATLAIETAAALSYGQSVAATRERSHGLSRLFETPQQSAAADLADVAEGVFELVSAGMRLIGSAQELREERKAKGKASLESVTDDAETTMKEADTRYTEAVLTHVKDRLEKIESLLESIDNA